MAISHVNADPLTRVRFDEIISGENKISMIALVTTDAE